MSFVYSTLHYSLIIGRKKIPSRSRSKPVVVVFFLILHLQNMRPSGKNHGIQKKGGCLGSICRMGCLGHSSAPSAPTPFESPPTAGIPDEGSIGGEGR